MEGVSGGETVVRDPTSATTTLQVVGRGHTFGCHMRHVTYVTRT